jgi:hypothetical protein|uniref:hypothetical protein n=1 Tax=Cephaloticoccus sp. TaxID=1985742 RepID=UPI00404B69B9
MSDSKSGNKNDLFLAIDERAFPLREHLALYLTKPEIRRDPVLFPSPSPDAPDNMATHLYGTVLLEDNRFRIWYYAVHKVGDEGGLGVSPVCYAESDDGENWTRPELGQVEWKGSRANNLIALGPDPTEDCSGVSVLRDDEESDPARRYKMVYGKQLPQEFKAKLAVDRRWVVRTATSPDGINWTEQDGLVSGSKFAELASFYKHDGLYIVNSHVSSRGEGDRQEGRQGYAWVSTDFKTWLAESAPSFRTAEPAEGSGWGTHGMTGGAYTQVHLGVGAVSLGNVAVGLYGMWHQRVPNWGEGGTSCDLGLVVSQDGLHFDEVVKGRPYIRSEESPANPAPGKNNPTILCQTNSILNVGAETWIYHGRWLNVEFQRLAEPGSLAKDYWAGVGLAKIPRDRWGALGLWHDEDEGSAWTMPFKISADSEFRANVSGAAGLRFELADKFFKPVPGFVNGRTAGDQDDALDAPVSWGDGRLRDLAGQTVRVRIHFHRSPEAEPRLFALTRK